MALEDRSLYFAKLDSNNIVTYVMCVDVNDAKEPKEWWDPLGFFNKKSENVGISFCQQHWETMFGEKNTVWKETRKERQHGIGFRGNYAGIGMTYMTGVRTLGVASTDIFISQRPYYASWPIGIMTARYVPPGPPGGPPDLSESERAEGKCYEWDENRYRLAIDHGLDLSTAWVLK